MSGVVVVSENGRGRYQQAVRVGQHHFIADEPASLGGDDAGPAPFDFVLAGLGACTSMTLRMYAERKAWPLTAVRVDLRHEKREIDGAMRDHVTRQIALIGDLSAEQRQRLLEIAEKCPVHRAMTQSMHIDSRLVEPAVAPTDQ